MPIGTHYFEALRESFAARRRAYAAFALGVAWALYHLFAWQDGWYSVDAWEFFARPNSLSQVFRPHQDHLQVVTSSIFIVGESLGLSFWPYFVLWFSVIGGFAVALWYLIITQSHGIHWLAGLAIVFAIWLYPPSAWLEDTALGFPLTLAGLGILLGYEDGLFRGRITRWLRIGLPFVLVVSSSIGALSIGALLMWRGLTRNWERIGVDASAFMGFLLWRIWGINNASPIEVTNERLSRGVDGAITVLDNTISQAVRSEEAWLLWVVGACWALCLVKSVTRHGRVASVTVPLILAIAYLGSVTYARFVIGNANPHGLRFAGVFGMLILLSSLGILRYERIQRLWPIMAVLGGMAVFAWMGPFVASTERSVHLSENRRAVGSAYVALVSQGEPFGYWEHALDPRLGPYLQGNQLNTLAERLAAEVPERRTEWSGLSVTQVETVRGRMRVNIWPSGSATVSLSTVVSGALDSCVTVDSAGVSGYWSSEGVTVLELRGDPADSITIKVSDSFGSGVIAVNRVLSHPFRPGVAYLSLAPTTGSYLEIVGKGLMLCGTKQ